ncbi:MAG: RNA polymerase sigma factor [Lentisphaeraceae bacterium]|nr:RNA polymerase sigma factor [Lentisphaeraceae bacterium]
MNDWNTRQTLLMRAKNPDDETAWEEFVGYYKDFLGIVIYKITGHKRFSDDLLQAVLLEIWRSLPNFETDPERAKFRTWMSRLVRNTVFDQLKKEYKQLKIREDIPIAQISPPELEDIIRREWEIHLSRLAIKNISERFTGKAMQVFELSLAGHSIDDISHQLSISKDSAYTLKNRVKKYLIREIKRLREELEL